MRKEDLLVVVTSVGTEEQALDIAHALVRNRQAACVNLMPNVHSIYRWKGRVCDDGEFLLFIKTRARRVRGRARDDPEDEHVRAARGARLPRGRLLARVRRLDRERNRAPEETSPRKEGPSSQGRRIALGDPTTLES